MTTHVVLGWVITHNPKPIPTREDDWDFVHEDFDGAPDSGDTRCGTARSFEHALEQILDRELDNE